MKRIAIFLLLMGSINQVLAGVVKISWPVNYSVFQRNTTSTGGSANVTFAGQFWDRAGATYRIEKLSTTGTGIGDWKPYQSLPAGSLSGIGSSASSYFYFTLSVPTGWYRLYIKDGSGSSTSVKFGVGEVFIIAGQSNARGSAGVEYIDGLTNYDCVVSNKNYIAESLTEFSTMEVPVFGVLNSVNKNIGPRGDRPWYYQSLGNQIALKEAGQVIPVCFFNVAHTGSSIDNWYESMQRTRTMFSSNYANPMVIGATTTTTNPWAYASFDNRFPYVDLKNALSYYGNLFGVRAVLWHQGEAETRTLLSQHLAGTFGSSHVPAGYNVGNYDIKLNAIIADTRTILPNVPWAISKVSLVKENTTGGVAKYNIVNNSGNIIVPATTTVSIGNSVTQEQTNVLSTSNVSWASQSSDTYIWTDNPATNKRFDGTHFNKNGLMNMAVDVYSNISSIFSKSPKLPVAPSRMQLTQISTEHYSANTGAFSIYTWSGNPTSSITFNQTASSMGNPWSSGVDVDHIYKGYTKDAAGRVSMTVPTVTVHSISGARLSAVVEEVANESMAYPNPVVDAKDLHVTFSLTESSPVQIQLIRENGEIADEFLSPKMQAGKHHFSFPVSKLRKNGNLTFIIYHLKTDQHNEIKKILLVK